MKYIILIVLLIDFAFINIISATTSSISNFNNEKICFKEDYYFQYENTIKDIILENSIGLLAYLPFSEYDTLKILNSDNTQWLGFKFDNFIPYSQKIYFRPFAYHPDYSLLVFKCLNVTDQYYEILVNDTLKKKLEKNKCLFFYSWEDFLLNYDLSVDISKTKIFSKCNQNSEFILNTSTVYSQPVRIIGNWLKISWIDESTNRKKYGWIIWKDSNKLLVNLIYF